MACSTKAAASNVVVHELRLVEDLGEVAGEKSMKTGEHSYNAEDKELQEIGGKRATAPSVTS